MDLRTPRAMQMIETSEEQGNFSVFYILPNFFPKAASKQNDPINKTYM